MEGMLWERRMWRGWRDEKRQSGVEGRMVGGEGG